jgi:hypothetical protein
MIPGLAVASLTDRMAKVQLGLAGDDDDDEAPYADRDLSRRGGNESIVVEDESELMEAIMEDLGWGAVVMKMDRSGRWWIVRENTIWL